MSSIARALRALRRELDNCRKTRPAAPDPDHATPAARDNYLDDLEAFHNLLASRRDSFKDVQRQYIAHVWENAAEQKTADAQAEEDGELLVQVDKTLSDVTTTIRRLQRRRDEAREHAKAEADRAAMTNARQGQPAPQSNSPR